MAHITFIGAGNMATSIIGGLISQGHNAKDITASDPNKDALNTLHTQFGIATTTDNLSACGRADVVLLAVKPQVLKAVAQSLAGALNHKPLVISIAAGITHAQLQQWLGGDAVVVRCMPNTPSLVQQGAAGLYGGSDISPQQRQLAEQLLSAVSTTTWLEAEPLIDAVTAVSGSGPAYFFLLMEAMIESGIKQGLSAEQARELTLQTAMGAATLAQQSDISVAELRRRVTSPGGTTEQALATFEKAGLRDIVDQAMSACAERSKNMATEFN